MKLKINNYSKPNYPGWYSNQKINEPYFAEWFIEMHPIIYVNGMFFDKDGKVNVDKLESEIADIIREYVPNDFSAKVTKLINALRIFARTEEMNPDCNVIHFANCDYNLNEDDVDLLWDETKICMNRLPVNYNPEAEVPVTWLKFLNDLLIEEDILTLQEFMGYCLIPTTRAQKMLIILGKGGEGKSRIGSVFLDLLGDNMCTMPIQKLASDKFARADLEGMLLSLDDDMNASALKDTNIIKSLATLEGNIDLEKKFKQSVQGHLYARMVAFTNCNLGSLYDKSNGFYRRQIILTTKDKPEGREDDPFLSDKLREEKEGILLWCIEGLRRLIDNNYKFSISDRSQQNVEDLIREENNIIDFLESDGYIVLDKTQRSTSKAIYRAYEEWCTDNLKKPFVQKTFVSQLKDVSNKYGLVYMQKIKTTEDKYSAGFRGIYPRHVVV